MDSLAVAILVTDGFEPSELSEPRSALDKAGAVTRVVSPKGERVQGFRHGEWGSEVRVDVALDRAQARDFDALLLPGGVMNPDALRMHPKAVEFVKAFFDADNRWRRSATAPGWLSRRGRQAGAALRRGRR